LAFSREPTIEVSCNLLDDQEPRNGGHAWLRSHLSDDRPKGIIDPRLVVFNDAYTAGLPEAQLGVRVPDEVQDALGGVLSRVVCKKAMAASGVD